MRHEKGKNGFEFVNTNLFVCNMQGEFRKALIDVTYSNFSPLKTFNPPYFFQDKK